MKLYIVRVLDAYDSDNDYHESYWFSKDKASERIKQLNDEANKNNLINLYFDIFVIETSDLPEYRSHYLAKDH